jgi:pimeloyl-ACP methyl ester carboxylesterase
MSEPGRLTLRVDTIGANAPATTLLLLPAAATRADDFASEGFLAALDAHHAAVNVVRSEVPVDIYAANRIVALLRDEVLLPLRASGSRIWVAGISLGGMTALACAEAYPELIEGVFAMAPWPGPRPLWSGIEADGGLAAWAARQQTSFRDERRVWRWLGQGHTGCEVVIGYGRNDRFHEGQQQLSATLPPERRIVVDGAHDWPTWRALWELFLDRYAPRWRAGAPDVAANSA